MEILHKLLYNLLLLPFELIQEIVHYTENLVGCLSLKEKTNRHLFEYFCPYVRSWMSLELAQSTERVAYDHMKACFGKNKIFLLGRKYGNNYFESYSFLTEKWDQLAAPIVYKYETLLFNETSQTVFLFGESWTSNFPGQSYNLSSKRWNPIPHQGNLYFVRNHPFEYHDKIYFMGGVCGPRDRQNFILSRTISNVCSYYDCNLKTWQDLPSMIQPNMEHQTFCDSAHKQCFLFGGTTTPEYSLSKSIQIYNFETKEWKKIFDSRLDKWFYQIFLLVDPIIYLIDQAKNKVVSAINCETHKLVHGLKLFPLHYPSTCNIFSSFSVPASSRLKMYK